MATSTSSTSKAVPSSAQVAQVALAVAVAQQHGWAVAWYSTLASTTKALQAAGLPTLPTSHPNWAAKQGGKAQGYLVATRGQQAVAWYAFTGHNGHAGRMGWAGTASKGGTGWAGANVGQAQAHLQAPAPKAQAKAPQAKAQASKGSKAQATSSKAKAPATSTSKASTTA